jgi:NAD(P)H-dependent FMN reductase
MSLHIALLYGSVREARAGIRIVRFLEAACGGAGARQKSSTPPNCTCRCSTACTRNISGAALRPSFEALAGLYRKVDAFAIVSGEYNHGIPPGLKNLLDHFLKEYFFRPSAIVCYSAGQFGGVRAAMQLRMMLAELGMSSTPRCCRFPESRKRSPRAPDRTTPASRCVASASLSNPSGTRWRCERRAQRACRVEQPYGDTSRLGRSPCATGLQTPNNSAFQHTGRPRRGNEIGPGCTILSGLAFGVTDERIP